MLRLQIIQNQIFSVEITFISEMKKSTYLAKARIGSVFPFDF